jgi:hypothetical protein
MDWMKRNWNLAAGVLLLVAALGALAFVVQGCALFDAGGNAAFDAVDVNRDGVISAEEAQAASNNTVGRLPIPSPWKEIAGGVGSAAITAFGWFWGRRRLATQVVKTIEAAGDKASAVKAEFEDAEIPAIEAAVKRL